ncbi:hypothetical protein [Streptomyces sp. AC555_RSS877]|uniref:hypothetical protein n=1 Tax=Streptomyces sp. AC555_RSS877 TaxID=2823688 RepID=UPI001C25622C|nr:hypothetical protein [Streptomyces sp. AC555_RSS877]
MARPRRDHTKITGKFARLAKELAALRPEDLTLKEASKLTGLSTATLSRATDPNRCPSWQTMVEYLTAFGEDPNQWRPMWEMYANERQRQVAGVPADRTQRARYQRLRPTHVVNQAEYAIALGDLRLWEGNPPYKLMVSRAREAGVPISQSTISDALSGKILPTEDAVEGILAGLLMNPRDPEYDEWLEARRVLDAGRRREKITAKSLQHSATRRVIRPRPMRTVVRRED